MKPAALDPTPSRVRVELADRLEGKPVQKLQVERQPQRTPDELNDDLVRLIEEEPVVLTEATLWPALLETFRMDRDLVQRLRPLLEVHAPGLLELVEPIDGEAKVLPAGDDEPSAAPIHTAT